MLRLTMPFDLREATPRDVSDLARLHVDTFRETHGGGPSLSIRESQWQRILNANDPTDFTFVAEDDSDQLVGFARGTRHDGGVPGYRGELNKIYVLRRLHGQGLGRLLVTRVADRFVTQGVGSMLLFGDARGRSNGFYEHLGAVRLLSPESEFHGAYGWPDLAELLRRCAQ
jgi:GNAT superfamily N-acetyltransferase